MATITDLPTDRPVSGDAIRAHVYDPHPTQPSPPAGELIPEGKMIDEMTGEVVDDSCYCDGTDDGYYTCSFPPCVVERYRPWG